MVYGFLAAVRRIDAVEVQGVLGAGFTADEEFPAVRPPERCTEVLVLILVEIRPHYLFRLGHVYDAYLHLWILLPRHRVAGIVQGAASAEGRIDGEIRHSAVVEAVESQMAAVR